MPWSHATQSGLKCVVEDNFGLLISFQFSRLELQLYTQSPFDPMDRDIIYGSLETGGQNSMINCI